MYDIRRPFHISIIVYLLCSLHILPTAKSQQSDPTINQQVVAPHLLNDNNNNNDNLLHNINNTEALISSESSSGTPNIVDYFHSLFSQAIPMKLDRSKTKVFLLAPYDNGNNVNNNNNNNGSSNGSINLATRQQQQQQASSLQDNSNLVFNAIDAPIERRQSVYMYVPPLLNESSSSLSPSFTTTGRSASGDSIKPQRSNENNQTLIKNPFANAPYESSNDLIHTLIEHVFSDLSLQQLPPEEVLFGRLPTNEPPLQSASLSPIDHNLIFQNYTSSPNVANVTSPPPPSLLELPRQVSPPSFTNSNNYQPLPPPQLPSLAPPQPNTVSPVRFETISTPSVPTISSPRLPPSLPKSVPRYEAGVIYSDENEPLTLDQDVYIDLNRISTPGSRYATTAPTVNLPTPPSSSPSLPSMTTANLPFNFTNYNRNTNKFTATLADTYQNYSTSWPTTFPINFDNNRNNFTFQAQNLAGVDYSNHQQSITGSQAPVTTTANTQFWDPSRTSTNVPLTELPQQPTTLPNVSTPRQVPTTTTAANFTLQTSQYPTTNAQYSFSTPGPSPGVSVSENIPFTGTPGATSAKVQLSVSTPVPTTVDYPTPPVSPDSNVNLVLHETYADQKLSLNAAAAPHLPPYENSNNYHFNPRLSKVPIKSTILPGTKTTQRDSRLISSSGDSSNNNALSSIYSSISQRSKIRDHSRPLNQHFSTSSSAVGAISTPLPPLSLPPPPPIPQPLSLSSSSPQSTRQEIPGVAVPSDVENNLINIISLPNYKFYLGKKS